MVLTSSGKSRAKEAGVLHGAGEESCLGLLERQPMAGVGKFLANYLMTKDNGYMDSSAMT